MTINISRSQNQSNDIKNNSIDVKLNFFLPDEIDTYNIALKNMFSNLIFLINL